MGIRDITSPFRRPGWWKNCFLLSMIFLKGGLCLILIMTRLNAIRGFPAYDDQDAQSGESETDPTGGNGGSGDENVVGKTPPSPAVKDQGWRENEKDYADIDEKVAPVAEPVKEGSGGGDDGGESVDKPQEDDEDYPSEPVPQADPVKLEDPTGGGIQEEDKKLKTLLDKLAPEFESVKEGSGGDGEKGGESGDDENYPSEPEPQADPVKLENTAGGGIQEEDKKLKTLLNKLGPEFESVKEGSGGDGEEGVESGDDENYPSEPGALLEAESDAAELKNTKIPKAEAVKASKNKQKTVSDFYDTLEPFESNDRDVVQGDGNKKESGLDGDKEQTLAKLFGNEENTKGADMFDTPDQIGAGFGKDEMQEDETQKEIGLDEKKLKALAKLLGKKQNSKLKMWQKNPRKDDMQQDENNNERDLTGPIDQLPPDETDIMAKDMEEEVNEQKLENDAVDDVEFGKGLQDTAPAMNDPATGELDTGLQDSGDTPAPVAPNQQSDQVGQGGEKMLPPEATRKIIKMMKKAAKFRQHSESIFLAVGKLLASYGFTGRFQPERHQRFNETDIPEELKPFWNGKPIWNSNKPMKRQRK